MRKRNVAEAEALSLRIAAGQYGLVNTAQLAACGLDRQAVYRRTKSGLLTLVHPGVYRAAGASPSTFEPIMAAVLWAGEGAVASHESAAALRNLPGFNPESPHVSITRNVRSSHGIKVHRVGSLPESERTEAGPIPITSGPRTLLDLASIGHPRLEKALDQMLRTRLIDREEMWLMLDSPDNWARRGTRALAQLLQLRTKERAPTQSEMEDLFRRVVRKHRLPSPQQQYPVALTEGTIHLDFAYPHAAVGIECDSYAWHMDRAAFERDRVRDMELQARGWVVLRFTWSMLRWRDRYVADQVRLHLALRTELRV
jgi:very-short-patch-repair endonuclease